jgi:NADH-quinone oxidoreductase subunit M
VEFPLLTAVVFLPLVGAAVVALLPKASASLPKKVALGFSVADLVLALWLLFGFDRGEGGYQFVERSE